MLTPTLTGAQWPLTTVSLLSWVGQQEWILTASCMPPRSLCELQAA